MRAIEVSKLTEADKEELLRINPDFRHPLYFTSLGDVNNAIAHHSKHDSCGFSRIAFYQSLGVYKICKTAEEFINYVARCKGRELQKESEFWLKYKYKTKKS